MYSRGGWKSFLKKFQKSVDKREEVWYYIEALERGTEEKR